VTAGRLRLTRRAALALVGGAAAGLARPRASSGGLRGGGKSRIARVEAFPLRYAMTGRFKFFEGPDGSPTGRAAVMVKVTDEDGVSGWGESVPIPKWSDETLETVTTTIRRYLAPELVGRDPTDIEGAHEVMERAIAPGFSTGQPIAKAGIDLALHDLAARLAGKRVHALWDRGPGEALTLSWTVNPRNLDEVDGLVAEGRDRGYRHFNVKVAPDVAFDVALCRRVKTLAPDGFLWADANGGYSPELALQAAPRLAEAGVEVLEAPLRPNRIAGYQALKRQGALPILMDEGLLSPVELAEFIHLGMLDGVAMKPARCGGLLPARRQIALVIEAGLLWLGSGLTDPDVSLAASVALFAAFGQRRPCALNGPQFVAQSYLETPLLPAEGRLAVPGGPGLGVTVDEASVRRAAAGEALGASERSGGRHETA